MRKNDSHRPNFSENCEEEVLEMSICEYLYTVTEIKEVPASAIEIEAPTDTARLTLYTCTPLWNPVNRLVVIAELEKVTEPRP